MDILNLNFLNTTASDWDSQVKKSAQSLKRILNSISYNIMSLANYVLYLNPPHIILNSLNLSQNIKELVTISNFNKQIQYKVDNNRIRSIDLYLANSLKYRQGFINFSTYGDAFLVTEKQKNSVSADQQDKIIYYYIIGTNAYLYPTIIDEKTVFIFTDRDGNPLIDQNISPNFKSGNLCIAYNYMDGDQDLNNFNIQKDNIQNYLIYPAGTGSYFNIIGLANSIKATLEDNVANNFIRFQRISLSPFALRFYIDPNWNTWTTKSWSLMNSTAGDASTALISDKDKNFWLGQPIYTQVVTEPLDSNCIGESIFLDSQERVRSIVTQGQNYFELSITSDSICSLHKQIITC